MAALDGPKGADGKSVPGLVTLTLERKDGSTEPFVFRVDESGYLPLRVERMELKNGFGNWALQYAAKAPSKAGILRVYRRVGETLVYREG